MSCAADKAEHCGAFELTNARILHGGIKALRVLRQDYHAINIDSASAALYQNSPLYHVP